MDLTLAKHRSYIKVNSIFNLLQFDCFLCVQHQWSNNPAASQHQPDNSVYFIGKL